MELQQGPGRQSADLMRELSVRLEQRRRRRHAGAGSAAAAAVTVVRHCGVSADGPRSPPAYRPSASHVGQPPGRYGDIRHDDDDDDDDNDYLEPR